MSLLTDLPQELLSSVLSAWLTIVDVAHLDSAFCSSVVRGEFLCAAYSSQTLLQHSDKIHIYHEKCDAMSEWIFKREALVDGLFATLAFLRQHERRKEYLKKHGNVIRWFEYGNYYDKGLSFADFKQTGLAAAEVAQFCPKLTRFTAAGCIDVLAATTVAQCCPLLEEFAFVGIRDSLGLLVGLPSWCPKLTKVKLQCRDLNEESLIAFVRSVPGLLSFSVYAEGVTDQFVRELAVICSGLTDVCIEGANLFMRSVQCLLQHCTSLSRLRLQRCTFRIVIYEPESDARSTSMRHLSLLHMQVDAYELEDLLGSCPHLSSLQMWNCVQYKRLDKADIGALCPALQEISFLDNDFGVNNRFLQNVSQHCHQLRVLEIPDCTTVTNIGLAPIVKQCSLLEKLDISGTKVENGVLNSLAQHCRGLRVLDLTHCTKITDKGVKAVMQGCLALEELKLRGCYNVTEALQLAVKQRYPKTRDRFY